LIDIHFLITVMLPAIIIAYVLGALPIAVLISRRAGVDIFDVGTGLAGASNVKRYVGKYRGLTVGVLDLVKGLASLIVGTFLGIDDAWIVLPALAAIMGHWNSVFTGFRGGDGLAILGGIMIGMFPEFGFGAIGVLVGVLVALGAQRLPYTSLLSVVLGYATVAALVANSNGDLRMALGLGGLSALVLARAALGHLRRRDAGVDWNDLDDAVDQKGYL
jgi:glycerol-3-phosphate acyltransferase PlsY